MNNIIFRYAVEKDLGLILYFIKELAVYEKMLDEVVVTEELLNKWLFIEKKAEVIFGIVDGEEIGFALFFHNFSTFLGKGGVYLEDLFIIEKYRKNGYGTKFFKKLANIAKERDCGRLEWTCLNWNKPSIEFYLKMGAKPMDEWTTYRLAGEKLSNLGK
jgi:GNAT superfamily N-acetyltransferase